MKIKVLFLLFFLGGTFVASEADIGGASTTSSVSSLPRDGWRRGFADVVERRLDAVVNIAATLRQSSGENLSDLAIPEGPFGDLFRDLFSVPFRERPTKITSLGSGFVVDPTGYIVTNYHVVKHVLQEKGEIKVFLHSGQELVAKVVGVDFRSDLALLKVTPGKPLTALQWGDSSKVRVGDYALTIGNPYGLGGTVAAGIISHTQRILPARMEAGEETTHVHQWLQTDASVNQGSSGGPLLDVDGNVIGINTSIFTPTGGNVGIALAIPSGLAAPIVKELRKSGCVIRGYIGVQLGGAVTQELAENLGLAQASGVLIDDVVKGAPADKSGIKGGDVVLRVNGTAVASPHQLRALVSEIKPGTKVELSLWRKLAENRSKELIIKVPVQELGNEFCRIPGKDGKKDLESGIGVLGLSFRQVDEEFLRRYEMEKDLSSGVIIASIKNTSPAVDKLKVGDLVLRIGDQVIRTPADCREVIREAMDRKQKSVLFRIARPEKGRLGQASRFHVLIRLSKEEAF